MVSFHKALAEIPITEVPPEFEAPPKKRKWEGETLTEEFFMHDPTDEKRKSIFDIELHLETPLPSHKLQQYLTIQSRQIHLCNTGMTMMKTQDFERNSDPKVPSLGQMSLDLELSLKKKEDGYDTDEKKNHGSTGSAFGERDLMIESSNKCKKDDSCVLTRSPQWWLSSEGDDHKEMITTVCMRCHMLVMLCKSSPACPNCKFMHPPDQNPSKFLKRKKVQPLLC
ncbi:uncharacterized protein LOC114384256 [Glycine soja]|uniref:Uncharacterized protein n=1 Tax=Glycine soja TaxID=3848 RepID=A0A0B2QNV1_GLYSO|nr:uncharacterized protein LOC114384256 [Glycine soja]KAG4954741.1 hypothetical protein JHK87_040335 [Glycine soja]KHN21839.1 hypothetical protein glysoja_033698 [Glycine soja]RZB69478.1 hypothetical protein D0Y65_039008 [Glycine soja]